MALSYFISDLQRVLGTEKVFTAGSQEYKQGLKRWASSIEKPAVSVSIWRRHSSAYIISSGLC